MKIKGLDNVNKNLNNFTKNVQKLSGTSNISITSLLNPKFMAKYTSNKYQSLESFLADSDFSGIPLEQIPEKDLDKLVSQSTPFTTWKDMLAKAMNEYVAKKLGF
ncbi:hypothetical protein [Ligilactobacillus salivarius]|uniref:hypothetical protein n=1 Tax=Ligilactobacillus salivarius TaxID=1624 RepID=UPI002B463815|nr:hypothetical protein [Ligilactobacillus salivarius]